MVQIHILAHVSQNRDFQAWFPLSLPFHVLVLRERDRPRKKTPPTGGVLLSHGWFPLRDSQNSGYPHHPRSSSPPSRTEPSPEAEIRRRGFFKALEPAFRRNARWSERGGGPPLGALAKPPAGGKGGKRGGRGGEGRGGGRGGEGRGGGRGGEEGRGEGGRGGGRGEGRGGEGN